MTRNKKRQSRTMPEIVLEEWAKMGERAGLGALADWLDEREEQPEFASLLRQLAIVESECFGHRVRFFWEYAGSSYDPTRETHEAGRMRGAVNLARAEEWLDQMQENADETENYVQIDWEEDEYADRSHLEDDDFRPLYGCTVVVCVDGSEWDASCGGIDIGWNTVNDDPYCRVMVAELASEIRHQMQKDGAA